MTAVAVLAMLLVSGVVAMPAAGAAVVKTPVVFVHGYGGCQDAGLDMEGPFAEQYYTGTPIADLHHIAYYGCDTDGESIVGAGPLNGPDCSSTITYLLCPSFLRTPDSDGQNTSIVRFSYELAWYLYGKFGATQPVDLVGSSMGGLIITYLVQQIAAHNPYFPPALHVPTVVTFSTPFAGANLGCYSNLECLQMLPTNTYSLIPAILKAGAPQLNAGRYTIWAAIGGDGCDVIPSATTTALAKVTFNLVYTAPCYTHTGYLWDALAKTDAKGTNNGKPFTAGLHALDEMHYLIDYQEKAGA